MMKSNEQTDADTLSPEGRPGAPSDLPDLPLESWAATKDTLHLWLQIVGKVKLAYAPPRNHWWHVTLHLDTRGITTRRIPFNDTTRFEIRFDFVDHFLAVTTSAGAEERFPLRDGLSVAEFDSKLHSMLSRLGLDVAILEKPYGVPMTTPLTEDVDHASYDPEAVQRFWRILDWSDGVFDRFGGWFCGKTSPPQLYWHSLDLAFARYNGASAPAQPEADPVTQEAYSHEVIAFGFWAGDKNVPEPAYYSYTAPEPPDLRSFQLPTPATWDEPWGSLLALLPYDAVRLSDDPEGALLAFLQSAYTAGATAAEWDKTQLESSWCPTPEDLSRLGSVTKEAR